MDQKIERFYNDKVAIADADMQRMTAIYERVKREIAEHLQSKFPIQTKDFIDTGSSSEGLKVIKPDEFDVLVPLDVSGSHWQLEQYMNDPCFVKIVGRGNHSVEANLVRDGCLSASQVRSVFQSAVQKLVNVHVGGNYRLKPGSSQGPAITLEVCEAGGYGRSLFSLDLVPLVQLGNTRLMAKSHPDAFGNPRSPMGVFWRRSFNRQESHNAKNITLSVRKILMIVKAIRVRHHEQLGMLDSYAYKVAFLHWYYENQYTIDGMSTRQKLTSYLSFLAEKLQSGVLVPYPVQSNGSFNLLKKYPAGSLYGLKNFVRRLADSEQFLSTYLD
ncbi:hypothetical protein CAPTEDRAFT_190767 [Capitella teleta]|uniref:Mab-21-like nucleotidyltransferase domain-containing protein n=1 Tax=Capitella teleta TaxID=283909 RepID=R7T578_CAPTE|nr:hypothetical protein CAPTEDRAFT_190767 [Capitella teleta]|eukprot:ELT88454.1 hypothetical protein CAPTEDRAFT_190767 [Capitella teleta]